MSTFNDLVLKAYDIYGSTLGIKSVQLPKADKPNQFLRLSDFHFFLKDEPLPSPLWKVRHDVQMEGKAHHCVPFRGGFYDYTDGKNYTSLQDWYDAVKEPLYGDNAPEIEDVLLYGRRHSNGLAYELTYGEMVEKLSELTGIPVRNQEADSWDTVMKSIRENHSKKRLKLYYRDPEHNCLVASCIMPAKTMTGEEWSPEKPKYIVPIMNKDPDKPVYRYTTSVAEIDPSLTLGDVFMERMKIFEGYLAYQRVLTPLSEIVIDK